MTIGTSWDAETELRFKAWEQSPARPWNKPGGIVSPASQGSGLSQKSTVNAGARGRPRLAVDPAALGLGSCRWVAAALGVSKSTVHRRKRQRG